MEVLTPKSARRSTRLRVEIPITVTSLDRTRPFTERCTALVVSCQGCGFRSSHSLPLEIPILLSDLPNNASVTARVASCLPLGSDGKAFLVGAALYSHGNVWGISDPPEDWAADDQSPNRHLSPGPKALASHHTASAKQQSWPYNLFSHSAEVHPAKK